MTSETPQEGKCAAQCTDGGYCTNPPVTNAERCRMHGGKNSGPPEKNDNAATHNLYTEHDTYYHNQPDAEQEWIFDFTNDLLDRFRRHHNKQPDMFDKEGLKNIAIDFHRIASANGWFDEKGMSHIDRQVGHDFSKEEIKINVWASEIRQYNESVYRRMQKHGLLDDPESQKADALGDVDVVIESEIVTDENVGDYVG